MSRLDRDFAPVRLSDDNVRSQQRCVSVANVSTTAAALPPWVHRLVDDAAIFPPGNAPLDRAVREHARHRGGDYGELVGPFLVSDRVLPDLVSFVGDAGWTEPLAVSVVVTGGAGAIEPAVRWAGRAGTLELRGVEIALRDEDDLAHNARRVVTMVDQLVSTGELDDDVAVSVEPPRLRAPAPSYSWLAALDELAAMDHRVKLRTGGADADAFPSAVELATCIGAVLDRELTFKCTAGLHNAVRHRDEQTGFERHGFLNVLLGTRCSLDGGSTTDVVDVLERADRAGVRDTVTELGDDELVSARRWFTGFGSCSVLEPLDDLVEMGLVQL
jgi:hypothetical protein